MHIISRRGRKVVEQQEQIDIIVGEGQSFGIIITDASMASAEDIERARKVLEDIRRQLEEIGRICNLQRAVYNCELS